MNTTRVEVCEVMGIATWMLQDVTIIITTLFCIVLSFSIWKIVMAIQRCVCVFLQTDLEARERQAEAQSQEEVQITRRTLEEEVRELMETM